MTYYHGTNLLIGKIDLNRSRNRVDFGKGFYLADKFGTARNWAIRKVELEGEGMPIVIAFEISPDIFSMHGLRFPSQPGLEWLEFICLNRRVTPMASALTEPRHDFNWIAGPIADDKVVDVVADYMRGDINADLAIDRLRALPLTHQLSIHTQAALNYVDEVNVLYRQLKRGHWTQNWIKRKT